MNVTDKPDDSIEHNTDAEPDEENEECEEAQNDSLDVQAVMHEELDGLAQGFEHFGSDGLAEDESVRLDQAAFTIAGVSEAFATVREIRGKVMGPAPRHFGSQGAHPAVSRIRGPKAKAAPGANAAAVKARKANSTCRVCSCTGHWGGDPECPGTFPERLT